VVGGSISRFAAGLAELAPAAEWRTGRPGVMGVLLPRDENGSTGRPTGQFQGEARNRARATITRSALPSCEAGSSGGGRFRATAGEIGVPFREILARFPVDFRSRNTFRARPPTSRFPAFDNDGARQATIASRGRCAAGGHGRAGDLTARNEPSRGRPREMARYGSVGSAPLDQARPRDTNRPLSTYPSWPGPLAEPAAALPLGAFVPTPNHGAISARI
jgi:hypothetical protein